MQFEDCISRVSNFSSRIWVRSTSASRVSSTILICYEKRKLAVSSRYSGREIVREDGASCQDTHPHTKQRNRAQGDLKRSLRALRPTGEAEHMDCHRIEVLPLGTPMGTRCLNCSSFSGLLFSNFGLLCSNFGLFCSNFGFLCSNFGLLVFDTLRPAHRFLLWFHPIWIIWLLRRICGKQCSVIGRVSKLVCCSSLFPSSCFSGSWSRMRS